MSVVFKQGDADGLCGLYAILNFLHRTDSGWDKEGETLEYLLAASKRFGWFSPHQLINGYEEYQLKAILELQFENYRMDFQCYFMKDVQVSVKSKSFYDLARKIVEKGGSLITGPSNSKHWTLITGEGDVLKIVDSRNDDRLPLTLEEGCKNYSRENGLVVLPVTRSRLDIRL